MDGDNVDIDDSNHPSWIIHSFSFDCLTFSGNVYYDVYATLNSEGVFEINFTSFDFKDSGNLEDIIILIDETEGALRDSLRSFTNAGSNLK